MGSSAFCPQVKFCKGLSLLSASSSCSRFYFFLKIALVSSSLYQNGWDLNAQTNANTQTLVSVMFAYFKVFGATWSLMIIKKVRNNQTESVTSEKAEEQLLYTLRSHLFMKRLGGYLRLSLRGASFLISENERGLLTFQKPKSNGICLSLLDAFCVFLSFRPLFLDFCCCQSFKGQRAKLAYPWPWWVVASPKSLLNMQTSRVCTKFPLYYCLRICVGLRTPK